jgi:hypothetical protein
MYWTRLMTEGLITLEGLTMVMSGWVMEMRD